MREVGAKTRYIKPFIKTDVNPEAGNNLKKLLNEQFNSEKPSAFWYIYQKDLFTRDLFSRRIIAWRLSETLKANK